MAYLCPRSVLNLPTLGRDTVSRDSHRDLLPKVKIGLGGVEEHCRHSR